MSEEKFTPGPWFIKQSEEIRSQYSPNVSSTRITILDAPGGQYQSRHVIAQVAKGNGRGEANAALIAAAPEMYHALQKLVCVLDDCRSGTDEGNIPPGILDRFDEATNTCRAALQKARGEE